MIDGSEKRSRQLAFELQNSHVCEKHSKLKTFFYLPKCNNLMRVSMARNGFSTG